MLDFKIQRDIDRVQKVVGELDANDHPTPTQLEFYANYILYGKDEKGQNGFQSHSIEAKTKYNSFARKQSESLEGLLEDPSFMESSLTPIKRSIYTNPKPTLKQNLAALKPLQEAIAAQEKNLERLMASPDDAIAVSAAWKLSHHLIELRRQQYTIQDEILRPLPRFNHQTIAYSAFGEDVRPLGLKVGHLKRFEDPLHDTSRLAPYPPYSDLTLDLENPLHIYKIYENWETLFRAGNANPYSNIKYLLETIQWYEGQTVLSPIKRKLLLLKKFSYSNQTIRRLLQEEFGRTYRENYISTIYKQEICTKVAATVTHHFAKWKNRGDPSKWQKCKVCGQWKALDSFDFAPQSTKANGYSSTCRVCAQKNPIKVVKGSKKSKNSQGAIK